MCSGSNICDCTTFKPSKKVEKGGASLDTLAQLGNDSQLTEKEILIIEDLQTGNIQDQAPDPKTKLDNQHIRNYLTKNLSLGLMDYNNTNRLIELDHLVRTSNSKRLAVDMGNLGTDILTKKGLVFSASPTTKNILTVDNEDKDTLRSYNNMFNCCREIVKNEKGKFEKRYCKNRLCLACNAIRQIELKNKYENVLKAWESDLYMVTLTVKNCKGYDLRDTIKNMNKTFVQIKDVFKKRFKDDPEIVDKFQGMKKLEVTSLRKNDYHPHFHILVRGAMNAVDLVNEWLERCTKEKNGLISDPQGQQIDKADRNITKELFKYFTKIISTKTKKVLDKFGNPCEDEKRDTTIYVNRLDTIFKSMRKIRVFQSFGFKLSDFNGIEEKTGEIETVKIYDESDKINYQSFLNTNLVGWVDKKMNPSILLSKYSVIDIKVKDLLSLLVPFGLSFELAPIEVRKFRVEEFWKENLIIGAQEMDKKRARKQWDIKKEIRLPEVLRAELVGLERLEYIKIVYGQVTGVGVQLGLNFNPSESVKPFFVPQTFIWDKGSANWIDPSSGEMLHKFYPSKKLKGIVSNIKLPYLNARRRKRVYINRNIEYLNSA